jgi:RHS repeat-associated protein
MSGAPISSIASRARLVDMNGSGTRDVLWGDGFNYRYADMSGAVRPWVLTHVENGLGKTTDFEYSTSTQLMLAAEKASIPWASKAPSVIHVVTKVTEKDNLAVVGRPAGEYSTVYEYRDPVYDGKQREFRGFRTARATHLGDANSPTAASESTFLLGECFDEDPNDGIDPCDTADRWRESGRESLKGLPSKVETFDLQGAYLSTNHHTYRLRRLYLGLDGREVRQAFESQSDTWLYDNAPFVSNTQPAALAAVDRELVLGQPVSDTQETITLRSTQGRAHIRGSTKLDAFGNVTETTGEGCVDGCPAVDETRTHVTSPARRNDDPTGWMWRTVETWVTGSAHAGKLEHLTMQYDIGGNLTGSSGELVGTLPLDRFHETNKPVAPTPSSASADGTIAMTAQTYDSFGDLTKIVLPNGRCRNVNYDDNYGELATSESLFVGSLDQNTGCGSVEIKAFATYDRGLALVVAAADLHGEKTAVEYDSFGRVVTMTSPDPGSLGSVSGVPSVKIEYFLTQNPGQQPYSIIHSQSQDGADSNTSSYRNAWGYVDGLGRIIVMLEQADPNAGDGGDWVASGLPEYDKKGAPQRAFLPFFWSGNPQQYPLNVAPATKYATQRHDAFGRQLESHGLDGTTTLRSLHHALSVDVHDAADLAIGPHANTPATVRSDGHGRAVSTIERIHVGNAIELRETKASYLPTGEAEVITRVRVANADPPIVRWMRYDSLGRLVLNVEPDTTTNFNADPSTPASSLKAWRYAYNDNGELVGTSDARGCGANFHYDSGGRLVAEDYSPCTTRQSDYSSPDFQNLTGIEVLYRYDVADPDGANINGFAIDGSTLKGRLVSMSDRASKILARYNGRGSLTGVARRVAKPGVPAEALANRYAPRWYVQTAAFDGADRPTKQTTGAIAQELLGQNSESAVTMSYTKRGTIAKVGSSYGDLVTQVTHDADGLPSRIEYGDVAQTTTDYSYDIRRRLSTVQTYRGPPSIWSSPPQSYQPAPNLNGTDKVFQSILEDADFTYDDVDNPVEIHDWRNDAVWPDGAKPVTRKMQYDDLYRVTRVDYAYSNGSDNWVSPFAFEDQSGSDARRGTPSPHVAFDKRVQRESFTYDWLGNITQTEDDARGFYDRSLGKVTNGAPALGPYRVESAIGLSSTRDGNLSAAYDPAGNLTSLAVVRNGPCLPQGATCSQRFAYDWDEVGRLVDARRWDTTSPGAATDPVPQSTPAVELRYSYDASDDRVLKTAVDAQSSELHTVYVFGSFELRRSAFVNGDYDDTKDTEVAYLNAAGARLARLHYAEASLPTLTSGKLHVLFELPDHLGGAAIVLDKETSELVERRTYMSYGGTDSDYRPSRWDSFREDYGFTGKEEDVEVGLLYFGKRYLSAALQRWTSADPLTVHAGGGDPNAYAYVSGSPLRTVDPLGLDGAQANAGADETVVIIRGPPINTKDQVVNPQASSNSGVANPPKTNSAPTTSVHPDPQADQGAGTAALGFVQWNRGDTSAALKSFTASKDALIRRVLGPAAPVFEGKKALDRVKKAADQGGAKAAAWQYAAELEAHNPLTAAWRLVTEGNPIALAVTGSMEAKKGVDAGIAGRWGDTLVHAGNAFQRVGDAAGVVASIFSGGGGGGKGGGGGGGLEGGGGPPGPPATLETAEAIRSVTGKPPRAQVVALVETTEGPTIAAGGAWLDLTAAQKSLAKAMGFVIADDMPGIHAEQTAFEHAGRLGLTPKKGVSTLPPCPAECRPLILRWGGWVNGNYFGF